ncbi:concanavalin A-like lectin/glucanase domain-containing protein [Myxozyma melibiosi]|uniref:Concanavalin A-like lectin/glucanase domain-containing protein n=1 Tax=Myxozyma melibiosi TaxID=54550 RepID=A0ABR1F492_9ASCO
MKISITGIDDAPTLASDFSIMYGKVQAFAQAAPGRGIVSALVLLSDDGDEIDIEWVGVDSEHFQSNYFSKGNTTTWNRGGIHSVSAATSSFHTYTIDWTASQIVWSVDGVAVRTLSAASAQGFPSSPSQFKVGSWVAGSPSNSEGTIGWAGGLANMSQAPFDYFVKGIYIEDYSTGTSRLLARDPEAAEILRHENQKRDSDSSSRTTTAATITAAATETANPALSPVGPVQNVTLPPVISNATASASPAVVTTSAGAQIGCNYLSAGALSAVAVLFITLF